MLAFVGGPLNGRTTDVVAPSLTVFTCSDHYEFGAIVTSLVVAHRIDDGGPEDTPQWGEVLGYFLEKDSYVFDPMMWRQYDDPCFVGSKVYARRLN